MDSDLFIFNSLSVIEANNSESPESNLNAIRLFSDAAIKSLMLKGDLRVGIVDDALYLDISGQCVHDHLKRLMQRTAFNLLMKKIKSLDSRTAPLDLEARCNNEKSVEALFATISLRKTGFGCMLGVGINDNWTKDVISVDFSELTDNDINFTSIDMPNVSNVAHVERWRDRIIDWGATIARSWKIWELDGMPVVMYPGPLEHPPPHIHLLDPNGSRKTIAKYLIQPFERPKGPHTWDARMRVFIEDNRDSLLRSWELCQKGMKPISLQ